MSFLDDVENLVRLDPTGWKTTYEPSSGRVDRLSYGESIIMVFYYNAYGDVRWVQCHPGGFYMGWLERRRLRKIQRMLFGQHSRKQAELIAEKVLRERQRDTDIALAELDSDLHGAFADLEAQEVAKQKRLREAPVMEGFLKGVVRKASTRPGAVAVALDKRDK